MRKMTAITYLIHEIAYLLDKGIVYSIDEVEKHIDSKDVIDWLENEFPLSGDVVVDFSIYEAHDKVFIHDNLYAWYGGYAGKERKKWGIENNGLCILICWLTEMVFDVYGRDRQDDSDRIEK